MQAADRTLRTSNCLRLAAFHHLKHYVPGHCFRALFENILMKNIIAIIMSLLAGSSVTASELKYESSMNFDLGNVAPFLTELDSKFNFGFDVKELEKFVSKVPLETEKSVVVSILVAGRESKMEFRVFMDDIDAPDLYMLFDSSELSESVSNFMMSWAEAGGM